MKTLVFDHRAIKDLEALPEEARESVLEALMDYALHGRGDIRKLAGRDFYRMRVGRYRVIFDEDKFTIVTISVGKRETTTYRRH